MSRKTQLSTDSMVSCFVLINELVTYCSWGWGSSLRCRNRSGMFYSIEIGPYIHVLSVYTLLGIISMKLLWPEMWLPLYVHIYLFEKLWILWCNIPDFRLCVHVVLCNCICIYLLVCRCHVSPHSDVNLPLKL